MRSSASPEFLTCPLSREPKQARQIGYYPPDFFTPPTQEERRQNYHNINEKQLFVDSSDVARTDARDAYADLNAWNREKHTQMVELLEPLFLRHIERIANFIIMYPHEIKKTADAIPVHQIPYTFAGLPPNLFDHLDPEKPFLPQTKQSVLDLINGFQTYNERLRHLQKWDVICNGKEDPYYDIGLELLRKQRTHPELFTTIAEQEAWRDYNQAFKQHKLTLNRPTFHQNVIAVNYVQNRQYSEKSGFFDKTDGMFDAFLLTDFYPSHKPVTSQVRIPFNYGHETQATELLKGTHVLMQLLMQDKQLVQEAKTLSAYNDFFDTHLTRARGLESIQPAYLNGLYGTMIEGAAVIGALFAECEVDGIPGFEDDHWEGLNAMLDDDIPVKLAASVPPAVIMPPTLHGNYFKRMLIHDKNGLRVRPEVAEKIKQMHDQQTITLHARWLAYHQSLTRSEQETLLQPVRFGLHCPFKSNVVRQMAETFILCRAALHEG
jgi:hypothetical protein